MERKEGQFFILAAVIIISIIAGIFLYTNQVFLIDYRSGIKIIAEEVDEETGVVINQYVARNEDNIENFTLEMVENLIDRKDSLEMIFIYNLGDNINIFSLARENISLIVNSTTNQTIESQREIIEFSLSAASIGSAPITVENFRDNVTKIDISFFNKSEGISFIWNGTPYESDWLPERNIYFVLREKIGEEIHTYAQ